MIPLPNSDSHNWKLTRKGGILQVKLETVEDLASLSSLDPKLWVALSCPVNGLEIDPKTLDLIDYDRDARVRIEEIKHAVNWTLKRLKIADTLFDGGDLPLAAINDTDPEGQALLTSAKQILENLGQTDALTLSVEQADNTAKIYEHSKLNGDGVIAIDATKNPATQHLIKTIVQHIGGVQDRSGQLGVTAKTLNSFYEQLQAYETWWSQGEATTEQGQNVLPYGETTPTAFKALKAVENKIEDYFARCRLAAFDQRAQAPLNLETKLYLAVANTDLSATNDTIEDFPLAQVTPICELYLKDGINPNWSARIAEFDELIYSQMESDPTAPLKPETWNAIRDQFTAYQKWRNSKPKTEIEALGILKIRELLTSGAKEELMELLAKDHALAPRMQAMDAVTKLTRYHRDLVKILHNFVNFRDFYDEQRTAIFQAGTLFLDGRECRLCIRVENPAKHAALASLSRAFVVYCDCKRNDSPKKFHIAAVFSAGDAANLIVGRNGIFRDRNDKLWDTTIVRIIENPISIGEAFLLPYVRVGRFIGDQLEKWATTRDKAIQTQLESGIKEIPNDKAPAKTSNANQVTGVASMLAATGIALGAVGAGIASLFDTVRTMAWWELPLITIGLLLMISFPSMFIAWLKIRKRTLAPLLDASGWAVNGRTLIDFKHGQTLTKRATLPINSECLTNKTLYKTRVWTWATLGIIIMAAALGWILLI